MLLNEKEQSKQKDSIINTKEMQLYNTNIIISEKEKINYLTEKSLKDVTESLENQKKNKNIWKCIAIGTTIISGTLIIK